MQPIIGNIYTYLISVLSYINFVEVLSRPYTQASVKNWWPPNSSYFQFKTFHRDRRYVRTYTNTLTPSLTYALKLFGYSGTILRNQYCTRM